MKQGKIISGFAGIGKSHLCKTQPNFMDLERQHFGKRVDIYADVAKASAEELKYHVLVGCDIPIIRALKKVNANFIVVIPRKEDKEIYMKRFEDRADYFIKWIEERWDIWIDEVMKEDCEKRIIKVDEYLSNIIGELL